MKHSNQISYAKTVYGKEEVNAVVKCLNESTQMGKYSKIFESKIANLFDKKYCLYVNSGSSALYIGVEAFKFPKGSEVPRYQKWSQLSPACLFQRHRPLCFRLRNPRLLLRSVWLPCFGSWSVSSV